MFWFQLASKLTFKVTSKVTSSGTHFRYFWLDSKGREASGGLAIVKEGGKAKEVQRKREREKAKDAK